MQTMASCCNDDIITNIANASNFEDINSTLFLQDSRNILLSSRITCAVVCTTRNVYMKTPKTMNLVQDVTGYNGIDDN